ncbi:SpoIVB peptidase [Haloimpatiens sp. FM7315]|uniref:SpoIVB peptidase n=1 Tax=Haloimpatiens sp. FM7315 TaxID=3298609 RepID=UPI0035A38AE9
MEKTFRKSIIILLTPFFILILSLQYRACNGYLNTITVQAKPNIQVYPGGQPIGVKLNTKGVLIIGLSSVEDKDKRSVSPSNEIGLKSGDIILSINNKEINTCEEVSEIVSNCEGNALDLLIQRKDELIHKKIIPVKCEKENRYKIGLWVRDSTAGIGTLTFYDDQTKSFGALGHAITDMDTGDILKVREGKIIPSSIVSVKKGVRGQPGELKGIFTDENNILGEINSNTDCGIFGKGNKKLINTDYNKPLDVGFRNEVKKGKAYILTTIDEGEPKLYEIEIQELLIQNEPSPKSMVIKITDKRLIDKTGGIIQGMSGSPIIQDNKIIGAVTHVLVSKPDVGYGVYIEWMLKDANILKTSR